MHTLRCLAFAGLSLTFTLPALCAAPNTLVGHWQDPISLPAGTSTVILDFRADGTEHILYRHGGELLPMHQKNGQPLVAKYTVINNKLVFTTLDGKHSQATGFKVQGDTLTFAPSDKNPGSNTLRRIK